MHCWARTRRHSKCCCCCKGSAGLKPSAAYLAWCCYCCELDAWRLIGTLPVTTALLQCQLVRGRGGGIIRLEGITKPSLPPHNITHLINGTALLANNKGCYPCSGLAVGRYMFFFFFFLLRLTVLHYELSPVLRTRGGGDGSRTFAVCLHSPWHIL